MEVEGSGSQSFTDQRVCLGSPRIWSDGKRVVVFEGILGPEKSQCVAHFESFNPEEYLLAGLFRCGSKFFQEIAQFRVVIWDLEKVELTCARDATGAQSFY